MPPGAKTVTQVLDGLAAGLSGTAIAVIGALGFSTGAVKLGFKKGDDDDELEKAEGTQEYSIEICGHSYTVDWAAPVCLPFFTGAALYKELSESKGIDDISDVADIMGGLLNGLSSISEPLFNLSMLDGVNSLLRTVSYSSDENAMGAIGQKIISNYITINIEMAV